MTAALPLQGITILDFSTLVPGPLASLILAEAGAEVIKIERPGGEEMRHFSPREEANAAAFGALNAGKKSLVLDLRDAKDRARLDPLLRRADVLIEQFRPGVMERFSLGYEAVRAINPGIVYCSITGYGQTGPRAGEAGHDLNYQAASGLLSLSPGLVSSCNLPAGLVADIAGGAMPAVINILLALRRRDASGEGARLDIAMADIGFTFATLALAERASGAADSGMPSAMLSGASPRYALYATRDNRFLAVGALEQKFWEAFCEVVGLAVRHRDDARDPEATRQAVAALVSARDSEAWRAAFAGGDCCATIVASLDEAANDPHFRARGLFDASAAGAEGRAFPCAVLPLAPSLRRPPDHPRRVPAPGEHGAAFSAGETVEERARPAPPNPRA